MTTIATFPDQATFETYVRHQPPTVVAELLHRTALNLGYRFGHDYLLFGICCGLGALQLARHLIVHPESAQITDVLELEDVVRDEYTNSPFAGFMRYLTMTTTFTREELEALECGYEDWLLDKNAAFHFHAIGVELRRLAGIDDK